MRKQILTLAAALAAFGAAWLGRDLAPRPGERVAPVQLLHRVPAIASVAPVGPRRDPDLIPLAPAPVTTESGPGAPGPARAPGYGAPSTLPSTASTSDSVGVLLARHHGKPAAGVVDDYYLYLPPGIARGGSWPVILYLHGRSLRGSDLTMLTRYGLPRYLKDGRDVPFIVIAPQLPDGQSWTDTERLAELLDEVLDRYPVDRDRVYLTGYSMGGGGVWRMALAHHDLFAAVAPMAALTPAPSDAYEDALEDLPIRIYHGTADESAPFAGAAAMAAFLRREGVPVQLDAIEDARHGDLTRIYGDRDLYDWFLTHRRD